MEELTCNLKLHVQEQGVLCCQLLLLNLSVQLQEINNHETDPVKIIKQDKKKIHKLEIEGLFVQTSNRVTDEIYKIDEKYKKATE
jgi:hypothetical protein